MLLRGLPSADYYQRMLATQTNTATLATEGSTLKDMLQCESREANAAQHELNPHLWHDATYGRRVVESFEETQQGESDAYSEATEQPHLQALDRISAQQYLERMRTHGCLAGPECRVVDLCCGPGNIIAKIIEEATFRERRTLRFLGIDVNDDELRKARESFIAQSSVALEKGNVLALGEVPPADIVICNTSLHEFEAPHRLLRVARSLAKKLVLVKDLHRPPVTEFWTTVRVHGQHYRGRMFQLFCHSLKSSLSPKEMQVLALREDFTYEDCPPIYGMLTWVARKGQGQRRTRRAS